MDVSNILYIKLWVILRKKILKLVTDHLFQVLQRYHVTKNLFMWLMWVLKLSGFFKEYERAQYPSHTSTLIHVFKVLLSLFRKNRRSLSVPTFWIMGPGPKRHFVYYCRCTLLWSSFFQRDSRYSLLNQ